MIWIIFQIQFTNSIQFISLLQPSSYFLHQRHITHNLLSFLAALTAATHHISCRPGTVVLSFTTGGCGFAQLAWQTGGGPGACVPDWEQTFNTSASQPNASAATLPHCHTALLQRRHHGSYDDDSKKNKGLHHLCNQQLLFNLGFNLTELGG